MFPRLRSGLRALLHRSHTERSMDAELRFHIDSYTEDLVRHGVPRPEAQRRAHLEFGSIESRKEECRASLGLRLFDESAADLRYAVRMLRQSPAFAAVAIASLALGIGVNTAIFTLANNVLLKSMAVPAVQQLRLFSWAQAPKSDSPGSAWGSFDRNDAGEMTGTPFPYPLFLDMRHRQQTLDDLVAFKDVYDLNASLGGQAEALSGILVSGNFYHAIGVPVIAGRAITPDDDTLASPAVAVISDAYWTRRFARSAAALGRAITVNHIPVTIVGINASQFTGPKAGGSPEIFLPISLQPRIIPNPGGSLLSRADFWWVILMGRLKPGIPDNAATAALQADFQNAFRATLPAARAKAIPCFFLAPGARGLDLQRNRFGKPMLVLLALAALVLAIACVNLANLLLARSTTRNREMSVRIALGASRSRVIRQVLTESMLLALLGGFAGLLLGYWGRHIIPNLFENSWTTSPLEMQFDWRVFAFALAVTVVTGLLFGVGPAWRATRTDANRGLKETGRMTTGRSRALLGKSLVVVQVSLSMLLLVGAGLFLRTLLNLQTTSPGINPERILLFELNIPRSRFAAPERIALYHRVEDAIRALPGVQSASLSAEPLLAGSMENGCYRPTGRAPHPGPQDSSWRNSVGADFFPTLGVPILHGRGFALTDLPGSPRVGVVNQQLAKKFFPNANPVGQTITPCDEGESQLPIQIVGVAADVKYADVRDAAPPTLYVPYLQNDDIWGMTFEVKTAASPESVLSEIRRAVAAIDRELPILQVRTQTEQIQAMFSQERVFAVLTGAFSLLALTLACIGIYGVMAYTVSRRTNEIGIRMALGAEARAVLSMILREATLLVVLGVGAGLAGALLAARLVASLLYGLKPTDPLTFAAAAALLLAVALLAGFGPALRAAHVDPLEALRHE